MNKVIRGDRYFRGDVVFHKRPSFKQGADGIGLDSIGRGRRYYVHSGTGSDGGPEWGLSPDEPHATLLRAIAVCVANRGDEIILMAGHAETWTAAAAGVLDKAGLTIIGQGHGDTRPTITMTNTAAVLAITGADCRVGGIKFLNGVASQVTMLSIAADDVEVCDCTFMEPVGGATQALNFITVGVADADSDRFCIHDCHFFGETAGALNECILINKDMEDGEIYNITAYADCDEACIQIPAGGNAQTNLHIHDCTLTNLLSGQHAIQINGTSSTGKIERVNCQTDSFATAIDAGGLEVYDCKWSGGTDDASAVDAMPINARYIKFSASMSSGTYNSVAAHEIATVTGLCKITVIPEISTALVSAANGSSSTIALGAADDTTLMIAATSIAGTGTFFNAGDIWTTSTTASAMANAQMWTEIKDDLTVVTNGSDIGYTVGTSAIVSGVIDFHIYWEPLEAGANVVVGAGGAL